MELDTIVCGDCLEIMSVMPDNSVNLIIADPPYYKVKKNEPWDRQWSDPAAFLAWIGTVLEACHRVLVANGSLYMFAEPKMSARIEMKIAEWFGVLNQIVWDKGDGSGAEKGARAGLIRSYIRQTERIIFAEHYGSNGYAKGEAGYERKCDELRGFVFEPLRVYLDEERRRAGVSKEDINEWLGFRRLGGMAGRHYFSQSQWCLPTDEHYHKMRDCFNSLNHGGSYLRREYEDLRREYEDLRREYEDLRREYEDLRRPFNATPDAPYTDVWIFKTVSPYPGKHPCEKPLDLIEHIIRMSSRPGDVVFDPFMGGGTTAVAALKTGRHWYGCDFVAEYVGQATERIDRTRQELSQLEMSI